MKNDMLILVGLVGCISAIKIMDIMKMSKMKEGENKKDYEELLKDPRFRKYMR
jgi:hypothetical protein